MPSAPRARCRPTTRRSRRRRRAASPRGCAAMFTAYDSVFAPSSSHGARAGAPLSMPRSSVTTRMPRVARLPEVRGRGGRDPRGRRRAVLDAAAEDELDHALRPGRCARSRARPPAATASGSARAGRTAAPSAPAGRGEPGLLRVSFDDADRLEDAVAALRAELAHVQRGGRRIDDGEGVGEVGAVVIGCRGVDHERETPGHALEPTASGMSDAGPSVTLVQPGRSNPGLHLLPPRAASRREAFCGPAPSAPRRFAELRGLRSASPAATARRRPRGRWRSPRAAARAW